MFTPFELFLKQSIDAETYEHLSERLAVSKHRLTKIKRDPAIMSFIEAIEISKLTQKPLEQIADQTLKN